MSHNRIHDRRAMFLGLAILLPLATSPARGDSNVAEGESLVRTTCSRCHAVGLTDSSRHPDAPAFRALSERYPIDNLEESLAEGISTGHPDMPEFVVPPNQIGAIIDYIESLQSK